MHNYYYIGNIRVPLYGSVVIIGLLICNLIAYYISKQRQDDYREILVLELFGGIGAVITSRILPIITMLLHGSINSITTDVLNKAYYSYYGGLIGFFLCSYFTCKIKKMNGYELAKENIFLFPLLHAIWKVGCFFGGCCYGVPYKGFLSVVYKTGVNRVAGIPVFPVQLLETAVSLLIMLILLIKKNTLYEPVGLFFALYGVTRFFIEFLRGNTAKSLLLLSEGQIYSIILGGFGLFLLHIRRRKGMNNE